MKIRVHLTGRFYHQAAELPEVLELPDTATVDDALAALAKRRVELPASCLISLAGQHLGTVGRHPAEPLADGQELLLIAPVAGG